MFSTMETLKKGVSVVYNESLTASTVIERAAHEAR